MRNEGWEETDGKRGEREKGKRLYFVKSPQPCVHHRIVFRSFEYDRFILSHIVKALMERRVDREGGERGGGGRRQKVEWVIYF